MNISGYVIERQIGKGGMAMVYRAIQESLGRPVALKVMNPLFSDTQEFSERFLDEGRLLASVHHSNIITIHDIGICNGFHFISMEYVEGGELGEKIKAGISPAQAAAYIETLADCLAVAHDLHIVHRDIKPANILFRKDGTLLLTDFGIAKQLTTNKGLTTTGAMIGSPHYLSPEQAQAKAVDGRADIYSLGVLYYEMLTGDRPFTGDSDVAIAIKHVTEPVPKLPAILGACSGIIDTMTRKDPDERFPSCRSLLVALREFSETGTWSGEIADIPLVAPLDPGTAAANVATSAHTETGSGGTTAVQRPVDLAESDGDTLLLDDVSNHDGQTIVQSGPPVTAASEHHPRPHRDTTRTRNIVVLVVAIIMLVSIAAGILAGRTTTIPETSLPAAVLPTPDTVVHSAPDPAALEREARDRRAREFLIESLLRDAEAATGDYRLTTPVATSAFTYYQKVLELAPDHAEALKGIDDIADIYHRLAKNAAKDWDYDKALRFAHSGLSIRPEHPALLALMRSLKATEGSTGRKLKNTFKGPKSWFN